MAKSRPQPTLADYMAIAISPGLIIILVGSLAFFLLLVFYAGEYASRLFWTTGCFVFAATLISRISIVEGAERASLFGIALGVVAAMAMTRYTNHPWGAWLVLGLIWWCASQLVWNCTLVEDDVDASGEGLLEAAGVDSSAPGAADPPPAATPVPAVRRKKQRGALPPVPSPPPQPLSKQFFAWWQKGLSRSAPPGLSVVYFSFGALPIFGLGQRLIAEDGRRLAFLLMVAYVGSALGLLLMTSFLGLRRYLRQRRLEMPFEMAGTWLGAGAALGVAIVLLAMFIPRPNPEYAISSLTGSLGSPQREASSYAPLHDSPAQGDSASTAPQDAPSPGDQSQQSNNTQSAAEGQQAASRSATAAGQSQSQAATSGESSGPSAGQAGSSQRNSTADAGKSSGGQQSASQQASQEQYSTSAQSPSQSQSHAQRADRSQSQEQGQQTASSSERQETPTQNNQQAAAHAEQRAGQTAQQQQSSSSDGDRPSQAEPQQQAQQQSQDSGQQGAPQNQQQAQSGQQNVRQQDQMSPQTAKDISQRWQQPRVRPPSLPSNWGLLSAVKLLIYAIVIIAGIYFLFRYWARVMAFLAAAWQELQALWRSLFGGRAVPSDSANMTETDVIRARPFSAFADPFASGFAQRNSANVVVQYSFEALEAWAAERGAARVAEETPLEFAARLTSDYPLLAERTQELASLYARVAYAREKLNAQSLVGVRQLWGMLRSAAGASATVRS